MKDLVYAVCPAWCEAYNCSNSSKINLEKTLFTLPKNEYTRKEWIAALNQKEGTSVQSSALTSNHLVAGHSVLTLLCYFAQLKHRA